MASFKVKDQLHAVLLVLALLGGGWGDAAQKADEMHKSVFPENGTD